MEDKNCLFSVKINYTEEEYIKFNQFHMLRKSKKILKYIILIALVLIFCAIYIFWLKLYAYSLIFSLLIAILDILILTAPKRITKKIIASDKRFGKHETTLNFYDDSLEMKNDVSNSKINYSDFDSCYEVNGNIYLYINKVSAILISNKNISEEQFNSICKLLSDKMKDNFIKVK